MPDGGRITIETHNRHIGQADAVELGLVVGDYVVMQVSDTGTGMTPDVLEGV